MHTIQLSDSMLYPLASMLAVAVRRMVNSRRLATVDGPAFQVLGHQYRDWRDLQTTLRGMQGETRLQVLSALRREIKNQRREKWMTPDFQTWLQQVRAADAERGDTTTYTPHGPGCFLRHSSF